MPEINEYFDSQVVSIGFQTANLPATVRMIAVCLIACCAISTLSVRAAPDQPASGLESAALELLITVRSGRDMTTGRLPDQRKGEANAAGQSRVYQTQSRAGTRQVRVLEGHSAYISHSQSVPYPAAFGGGDRHGEYPYFEVEYRDLQQGFAVRPRLVDGQLLMDISAGNDRWSNEGGSIIDSTVMQTTIRGELGQWIRLGSVAGQPEADPVAHRKTLSTAHADEDEIWVRVEKIQ